MRKIMFAKSVTVACLVCLLTPAARGQTNGVLPPAQPLPAPATPPLLAPVTPAGIGVNLVPITQIPPDPIPGYGVAGSGRPVANISLVLPDPGNAAIRFVTDTSGIVYRVAAGQVTRFLDLTTQPVGFAGYAQSAMQGVAFDPNFGGDPAKPGYGTFYTTFSAPNSGTASIGAYLGQPLTYQGSQAAGGVTVVMQWNASDPNATSFSGSFRPVMTVGTMTGGHDVGMLGFNPTATPGSDDYRKLYVGIGVGSFTDYQLNGGTLANPQGKVLRIEPGLGPASPPYTVPGSNPFFGVAGALPEIYAYGLRYPQNFSWNLRNGDFYITDIGQARIEPVYRGIAGANYGFPYYVAGYGTVYAYGKYDIDDQELYPAPPGGVPAGITGPVCAYDHDSNGFAVGSGVLYTGSALPELSGRYIFADIVSGRLMVCDPATAAPGAPALVQSLLTTLSGDPIDLRATYGYCNDYQLCPRIDLRLSQLSDGELALVMRATGTVYSLTGDFVASTVPEPAGLALPALLSCALLAGFRQRKAGTRRI
jgi:hypothetical protein